MGQGLGRLGRESRRRVACELTPMWVRCRQVDGRLQFSVLQSRNFGGGRIKSLWVCGLPSLKTNGRAPSAADRRKFWARLEARLDKLASRFGDETLAEIRAAVASHVPRPKRLVAKLDSCNHPGSERCSGRARLRALSPPV